MNPDPLRDLHQRCADAELAWHAICGQIQAMQAERRRLFTEWEELKAELDETGHPGAGVGDNADPSDGDGDRLRPVGGAP